MDKNFDEYDVVILDGFGTLYDKNYTLLDGAKKILEKLSSRAILLSNTGSFLGKDLSKKLQKKNISPLPPRVYTSLDFLFNYFKKNNINNIYHFGSRTAKENLISLGLGILEYDDNPEIIVFTSLPSENWIEETQKVLRIINKQSPIELILANPDRLLPGEHVGINVGMMFDMITRDWPSEMKSFEIKEIGKPHLSRKDLFLSNEDS